MTTENVLLIGVIFILFVMQLRTNWRLGWLEYRSLLAAEIIATGQGDHETARMAREEIIKEYRIFAMLTEL